MARVKCELNILRQEEIELIHENTLRILENVGLQVPNDECLELCRKAGAIIDKEKDIVRIPSKIMEQLLEKMRGEYEGSTNVETPSRISGSISTQVFVADYKTRTRRYGCLDDVMKGISLVEHLNNIPSSNAVTVPSDIHHTLTDVVSYQKIYEYSEKPGGTYILSPESARYIIEMSKIIGREVGYLLETVSPLRFRKESLEMALIFVKENQPLSIAPMVMGGASAPITAAGTVTLMNAEVLGSIFVIYAISGKINGFYGHGTHSMDMSTLLCSFGSPNQALLGMASAQMAKFYGINGGSNSGLTDALLPDFQAGFEKALTAIFSCMGGTVSIGAQGIVGADQGFSFEQLVIDNEWLDAYNYTIEGFEVTQENIAADLIEKIGIGGNFMAEEHTVKNMRSSYWFSKIFNRNDWDEWRRKGSKTIEERAHEFVEDVTRDYNKRLPVIDERKFEEIEYIVKKAKDELYR
ncbi:trimethylamine methyltransferase family protein [Mahella australiensis]|uniref:Trimethylamine methyltransferase n=1 Tax=Mahella australiensis (strain DSM 15567 / CIP 107919 / 50-1 BON) TaxID=697281 RepID=F3ZZQ0_MAHA5|nr:trimethylamine methyltransferase family protein [Mahella australiensis]AEE97897.1 trimethylamine methyltransferase [Mahella australiensis 50-1 BON]